MVVGAGPDPIEISPIQLLSTRLSVQGWASGIPTDSEDAMGFAALNGVHPMIETYRLEKAAEAYQHMITNKSASV